MEFRSLSEKAAYLSGLVKGKGIDDEVTALITELLGEMAEEIDRVSDSVGYLDDAVADMDTDLSCIIDDIYGDDDDDDEEDTDEDDEGIYEVTCPHCGDVIYLSEEDIEGGMTSCPVCGESLELIVDEDGSSEE